ncbi:MAG: MazG nucleotide pyrophosphohydrolase domain-containing protein, partial [Pseudomonadota bacterium]
MNNNNYLINPVQIGVNDCIMQLGGYWPPLCGLARLMEEYAELLESIHQADAENIQEEIADCLFIAITIANQYCARIDKTDLTIKQQDGWSSLELLAVAIGELARTLNCYEGLKPPKPGENLQTVETCSNQIFALLNSLAADYHIDLDSVLAKKINWLKQRDKDRFSKAFDPSQSELLAQIELTNTEKIWAGPTWDPLIDDKENINANIPHLLRFLKVASFENITHYLFYSPDARSVQACLQRLLQENEKILLQNMKYFGKNKVIIIYNDTKYTLGPVNFNLPSLVKN